MDELCNASSSSVANDTSTGNSTSKSEASKANSETTIANPLQENQENMDAIGFSVRVGVGAIALVAMVGVAVALKRNKLKKASNVETSPWKK